ncbi:CBR-NOS-2 protein [Ditylenchus destructor]|uniref:CBR-NOS-2 protein n=1 Tax=Ditylenchus destructor TaxID=166010 RepID=A0AAD4QSA8_9BILA|nr:CBR-NOS-2 protein [Ditylenchus destructor]
MSNRTCAYCLSLPYGESQAMSYNHTKKNCPRLVMLNPCKYCGASGTKNHTHSHCPKKPRISLTLKRDNDSSV